jgi:hypothetical protein
MGTTGFADAVRDSEATEQSAGSTARSKNVIDCFCRMSRMASGVTAVCALLLGGCSESGAVRGVFNNQRDYDLAIRESELAWARRFGPTVTRQELTELMRRHDGECVPGNGEIVCIVNVDPTRPSVFLQRHMWKLEFRTTPSGELRKTATHVDHLGWDL